jgi:hypothetical protein
MEPCPLPKFQMAPLFIFLTSSGSKKYEPRCVCLEWSQGLTLTQNVDRRFLLSVTFPTGGVITQFITYKCFFKVLFPLRRPIITLRCVLVQENNRVFVARLRPKIISQACLCALQRPRHSTKCWFSIHRFTFLLIFCLLTPRKASGPTNLWTEPSLASLTAISFPCIPAWLGTQCSPTVCRVEVSFNAFCYSRTNGNVVLAAWSAFRAAWLSEQTLTYFSGLSWFSVIS